ncbi:MAG: hypothetical protein ABJB66_15330 [Gemmatimonadaceae bacterium]
MSEVSDSTKTKALIGLGAALAVTIGSWFFINKQTDSGLARLERMDAVWAVCKTKYATATTASDTSAIDVSPLSAAIDSGKSTSPRRCGDLRRPDDAAARKDSIDRAAAVRDLLPPRRK